MKTIRRIGIGLFCAAAFSSTAFAQLGTQAAAPVKIAVISSFAFTDEKTGITKFVAATKTLNGEFAKDQTDLQTMSTRLQALAKEIDAARGNSMIDPKVIQAKIDEGEKLQREVKFKQDDAKARFERRQQALLGPVMQAIGKALTDFARQKGYLLIFDISKDANGLLIAVGDDRADVTKEFIAFYNTRP